MTVYNHTDYSRNPQLAIEELANHLREGAFMLFLGAGVSKGFGLPGWHELVARLLGKDGDPAAMADFAKLDDRKLAELVDDLDDGSSTFVAKVKKALYATVAPDLTQRFARSPLLLAVAALSTGTCRGRVSSIITFNYDDLLKQYLEMLGYSICVRMGWSDLSTRADTGISHVHGYLPQSGTDASEPCQLVLSAKSYGKKRSFIDEGWSSHVTSRLSSKLGLFVGLSGDDSSIADVLRRAAAKNLRNYRYAGYWLMSPDAYERNSTSLVDAGMCPIHIEIEQLPAFIFEICREAGQK